MCSLGPNEIIKIIKLVWTTLRSLIICSELFWWFYPHLPSFHPFWGTLRGWNDFLWVCVLHICILLFNTYKISYYTTSYDEIGFSPKKWGTSIFTPLWNRVGGSKNAFPLEMSYLVPNKAISIKKSLYTNKLHGSMNTYTSYLTNSNNTPLPPFPSPP